MSADAMSYRRGVTGFCEEPPQRDDIVPLMIVMSIYGVIGFVGNVIILYVYGRTRRGLTHSTYVFTLAIVDFTGECNFHLPSRLEVFKKKKKKKKKKNEKIEKIEKN